MCWHHQRKHQSPVCSTPSTSWTLDQPGTVKVGSGPRPTLRDRRDDEKNVKCNDAKCNVAEIGAVSSRSISAGLPISYCLHVKVGSASGRQVSPVIPEVSRRCDVTPEVETVTYRVYRVLSQQVCVLDKR